MPCRPAASSHGRRLANAPCRRRARTSGEAGMSLAPSSAARGAARDTTRRAARRSHGAAPRARARGARSAIAAQGGARERHPVPAACARLFQGCLFARRDWRAVRCWRRARGQPRGRAGCSHLLGRLRRGARLHITAQGRGRTAEVLTRVARTLSRPSLAACVASPSEEYTALRPRRAAPGRLQAVDTLLPRAACGASGQGLRGQADVRQDARHDWLLAAA